MELRELEKNYYKRIADLFMSRNSADNKTDLNVFKHDLVGTLAELLEESKAIKKRFFDTRSLIKDFCATVHGLRSSYAIYHSDESAEMLKRTYLDNDGAEEACAIFLKDFVLSEVVAKNEKAIGLLFKFYLIESPAEINKAAEKTAIEASRDSEIKQDLCARIAKLAEQEMRFLKLLFKLDPDAFFALALRWLDNQSESRKSAVFAMLGNLELSKTDVRRLAKLIDIWSWKDPSREHDCRKILYKLTGKAFERGWLDEAQALALLAPAFEYEHPVHLELLLATIKKIAPKKYLEAASRGFLEMSERRELRFESIRYEYYESFLKSLGRKRIPFLVCVAQRAVNRDMFWHACVQLLVSGIDKKKAEKVFADALAREGLAFYAAQLLIKISRKWLDLEKLHAKYAGLADLVFEVLEKPLSSAHFLNCANAVLQFGKKKEIARLIPYLQDFALACEAGEQFENAIRYLLACPPEAEGLKSETMNALREVHKARPKETDQALGAAIENDSRFEWHQIGYTALSFYASIKSNQGVPHAIKAIKDKSIDMYAGISYKGSCVHYLMQRAIAGNSQALTALAESIEANQTYPRHPNSLVAIFEKCNDAGTKKTVAMALARRYELALASRGDLSAFEELKALGQLKDRQEIQQGLLAGLKRISEFEMPYLYAGMADLIKDSCGFLSSANTAAMAKNLKCILDAMKAKMAGIRGDGTWSSYDRDNIRTIQCIMAAASSQITKFIR